MRSTNCPWWRRAYRYANSPERTLPMCSEPVGLGAKRVRTVTSLPLDSRRRFRRDVINDADDALDLVGNPARLAGEKRGLEPRPIRRHPVHRLDRANRNHAFVA